MSDRFDGIERLEEAVAAGLGSEAVWEIRGEHAVLRAGQAALGLRLEVVPQGAGRVAIRLEGDLATPELEALLRSLPVAADLPVSPTSAADRRPDVLGCRV
ncbi:MAG: hypothetical protein M9894_33750 [Planctomycetes bacterium]|nr:hypothetical protein [Planctomycetota bacterium]